jgi:hypothetical protein
VTFLRGLSACTLTIATLLASPSLAQDVPYRAAVSLTLRGTGAKYGFGHPEGLPGIFSGEDLVVDVSIHSRYSGLRVAAENNWIRRLSAQLWKGRYHDRHDPMRVSLVCPSTALRSASAEQKAGRLELAPGGSQTFRCRVRRPSIEPGIYTLTLGWDRGSGLLQLREERGVVEAPTLLDGVAWFSVLPVETNEDQLDLLLHEITHAVGDGDHPQALRLIEELLMRQPDSIDALVARARIRIERRDCSGGAADYDRAAAITENPLDARNRQLEASSPEERRALAEGVRREARELARRC